MSPALFTAIVTVITAFLWPQASLAGPATGLVPLPAGQLHQGDPEGDDNEIERVREIAAFSLMGQEVTNHQFRAFVAASGHVTDPEQSGFGYVWDQRWRQVPGATWRHPRGPETGLKGLEEHPVVQVSARDAAAFCAWYGLRLPSDEEWEYAARGDRDKRRYPWGDGPPEDASGRKANFGTLPCCAPDDSDSYETTAPVGSFPQGRSPFGLDDLAGNVWEWTASAFPGRPDQVALRGGGWGNNPYCLRTGYRHGNPPDIGLDMVGFRCAGPASAVY